MTNKYFDDKIPCPCEKVENPMIPLVEQLYDKYNSAMEVVDFTAATKAVMELCECVNHYVEDVQP